MSIALALSNAVSGLTAATRAAQVTAANVANASTPGYGRRSLDLSAALIGSAGAGVRVDGVRRAGDEVLASDIRGARAGMADGRTRSDAVTRIAGAIGSPDLAGSLSGKLAALDQALRDAAAAPADEGRIIAAARALENVVTILNGASGVVAGQREAADAAIARDVARLNAVLAEVEGLNAGVVRAQATGRDHAALLDRRRQAIDSVADIVPLHTVEREGGRIALLTETGRILLDGPAPTLEFAPVRVIDPSMTVGGALSHVTLDGRLLTAGPTGGDLVGGSLGASFAVRDGLMPGIQADLDALAAELAERFGSGGADSTIPIGSAGLLTDWGGPLSAAPGLAGRLAVDPILAAEPWRLRDGLGATGPSDPASGGLLLGHAEHLMANGPDMSPQAMTTGILSDLARLDAGAGDDAAAAAVEFGILSTADDRHRVDLDAEMSQLVRIEHLYQANAKLLEAIDSMLQRLTEI